MKLLGSNTSPYVRKVRLVLLEKNIPHEYIIDPPQEPGSLVLRVNPLGRIPALILDDGFCVFDSTVIADYADTLNDAPILIPRDDPAARLRVKRWEALADGIMDSAIVVHNESVRPKEKQETASSNCTIPLLQKRSSMHRNCWVNTDGAKEIPSLWPTLHW